MTREVIQTNQAPKAIGCYSQALMTEHMIYLSGQIPLDPNTSEMVVGGIKEQVIRVFENLKAVAEEAGSHLDAIVKLTVYLTDINHVATVNDVMKHYFKEPYPARTSIAVSALPKGSLVEIDGFMIRK